MSYPHDASESGHYHDQVTANIVRAGNICLEAQHVRLDAENRHPARLQHAHHASKAW
jgi:hypothetical protein